jgi:NAD(P)-dependent dehydrogenase (short-subunit alcohol dehydrogenase family)
MENSKGVALVTGASQGMGKAIALRLANDGYDVAINDISGGEENLQLVVREIEAKGRKACSIVGDVSIESDVQNMVATTVTTLGGLDVVSCSCPHRYGYVLNN